MYKKHVQYRTLNYTQNISESVELVAYRGCEVAVVDGLTGGAHYELRIAGGHQPLPAAPTAHVLNTFLRRPGGISAVITSNNNIVLKHRLVSSIITKRKI